MEGGPFAALKQGPPVDRSVHAQGQTAGVGPWEKETVQ